MAENLEKKYKAIVALSRHTAVLDGVQAMLGWDQETYMPDGASEIRAEQMSTMAGIIHKEKSSKKFGKALSHFIDLESGQIHHESQLSPGQKASLKKWRKDYLRETILPASFVKEFAEVTSKAMLIWRDAKNNNDFKSFAPILEKIISLSKKKAELFGYQDHPYDALMDLYEEGMTTKEITALFNPLRVSITDLLKKIRACKQVDDSFLWGKFTKESQLKFGHLILHDMGYDLNFGRLDISAHPFSTAFHPTDSRITTRIHPESLISNISAVLHEGGHALYEMGLPAEYYGTPLGTAISLGIHESQSRWWETRIGQSKAFWKHYLPLLKNEFGGNLEKVSLDDFYKAINKVEPSFIRVEADEVTYPLHVVLRFEIEKDLIEGKLKVLEIPEAWNAKMQQYLGITPKTDREGCLQDVHWSMGGFGYFSTYTLGNLFASQFFTTFEKDYPDWEKRVEQGQLLFIKEWLNKHIHSHGQLYNSKELVKEVTGHEFSSHYYIDYLTKKYVGGIYH